MENKIFWISGNVPSSKNSKVWTGEFLVPSVATQKWVRKTKPEWIAQKNEFIKELETLSKPYYIEFTFIRKTKHKFDYINILQAVLDEMKKHGWLDDDNADEVKPFFGDYEYNKQYPGVFIKILKK